jgi:hypothetical protein
VLVNVGVAVYRPAGHMPKSKTRSTKKRAGKHKQSSSANGSAPAFGSKTAFVRARPNKTAQEVVAEAAQQGLTLSVGYVYNIRATAKKNGGSVTAPALPVASGSGIEMQLRTLVLRIGLDRAERILSEIRTAFAAADGLAPRRRRQQARSGSSTSSESGTDSTASAQASA